MNKAVKTIVSILLLFVIAGLAYMIVRSIQEPVKFDKAVKARETVGIQRMKDIRDLQVAYKSVNGKFCSTIDSLITFYNTGKMEVLMQVGSNDDSLAVAHTDAIKKGNKKITAQDLYQLYQAGDKNLVFTVKSEIPVRDTLFASRKDFKIGRAHV